MAGGEVRGKEVGWCDATSWCSREARFGGLMVARWDRDPKSERAQPQLVSITNAHGNTGWRAIDKGTVVTLQVLDQHILTITREAAMASRDERQGEWTVVIAVPADHVGEVVNADVADHIE